MPDKYRNNCTTLVGDGATSRSFRGPGGTEHFIAIKAPLNLDFKAQMNFVEEQYRNVQKSLRIDRQTAVFQRVFLSDVLNQAALIKKSTLVEDTTATSIVQQSPLPGSKVELLAYHINGPTSLVKKRLSPNHLLVEKNGQRHLWSTQLCTSDSKSSISAEAQTRETFTNLIETLEGQGATLQDNCVRTWIFVKDVDLFYKGMVDSRRQLFAKHNLVDSTHYIASTGIEGACAHQNDLIAMDAYSNLDLARGQISYLSDLERLCPTKNYNVTFERGTRIAYADRAHCYISGTASIDKAGNVIHLGDVMRQLERALENVDGLLRSCAASLADLMYLIVYLRDAADFPNVDGYLRNRFPVVPIVIVQGAVCRPAWLVEVEGIAITRNNEPSQNSF